MSPQEKPTAPFVLSLVAGVLFVLGAFMPSLFWSMFGGMEEGSRMGETMGPWDIVIPIVMGVVGLAFGGIVLYAAIMLNSRPAQHVTWGTLILVFSILSMPTSMGGFGIGLILGVIGGALAIAWRPVAAMPPQATAPPGRFCTHCGRAIPMDARFCLYCGKELPG